MRKVAYTLVSILLLCLVTSCAEIESILGLIPKFDTELPNLISGTFVSNPEYDEDGDGTFREKYFFDSKNNTFTKTCLNGVEEKGTYVVEYETFAITKCNGRLHLTFENNEKITYGFYLEATANTGPQFLQLNNEKFYYVEGL